MSDAICGNEASWYLLQTKPRQEFRALEQLENQQYTCLLPTLQVQKVTRGKLMAVTEPLFSTYLFIQLDTVASNWGPLRSTRGVSRMVQFGGKFATVSDTIVDALRRQRKRDASPLFEPGEKVAVMSGPLTGLEGAYQMMDGEARALVLVELISQPQKLLFGVEMLRKAA